MRQPCGIRPVRSIGRDHAVPPSSSWSVTSFTTSNRRLPFGVVTVDLVAFFLVDERAADRRRRRDHAAVGIRVFRHHQLIDDRLPCASFRWTVEPKPDPVVRNLVEVHQRDLADALLQHADARFDQALPLFRGVILGVLPQVAQLARALDLLRQLGLQLLLELMDLFFELLQETRLHRGDGSTRMRITMDRDQQPSERHRQTRFAERSRTRPDARCARSSTCCSTGRICSRKRSMRRPGQHRGLCRERARRSARAARRPRRARRRSHGRSADDDSVRRTESRADIPPASSRSAAVRRRTLGATLRTRAAAPRAARRSAGSGQRRCGHSRR